ncbi:hydrolase [Paenibacillus baekrokdamisoli]|uniref:Hydrolase n=1 Tax=Paenibacillus baekrokdamisoli TaxID=1712516 RepID=A0A3G9J4T9_9BACL|nr:HAD family hydrolase [Paenibacillus baekrokdamisoli]BBH18678.1 hydrolase [Paenibacillus baekrokdamisoli]
MNFVFDLDGTICFKGKPVTEKIGAALEMLQSKGHSIIFASARPIRDMLPVLDQRFHTYTMIGGNGSLISLNGELKYSTSFSGDQMTAITTLLNEFEAAYLIDGEWDYSYTGSQDHPILNNVDPARLAKMVPLHTHKSIVKVLILSAANMEELAERIAGLDVVVHKHKNENVLDISPKDIHKWEALRKLSIESGNYIAFGNDANDMTMFMNAKHSVMIGHHEELAKHATESISLGENIEDRIVEKLNQLAKVYAL